jgi:UDP-N-acetylglucosamine--N-acetylmuramyl-(pentapeptide) pyrophosphoryl-undecaprenol N-acetylglucosamine transferase
VECPKLIRSFSLQNFKIPFELKKAETTALKILEKEKPDLVFSKGGFASYPAVWAANRLKIPALTHESDLSPGIATKLMAKKCVNVFTSFPETAELFENGRCVGSPMRKEIFRGDRIRAMHKYDFSDDKPVLLVLGGGSGSKALNQAIRDHLKALLKRYQILHLCGKGNLIENPPDGYAQREYESDMGSAYAAADLVLCRAGSNTVFELMALKKPSLLVPLQKCSRGDQLQNAVYFQKKNLCHILGESELDLLPSALAELQKDEVLKTALKNSDIKNGTPLILELMKEILK